MFIHQIVFVWVTENTGHKGSNPTLKFIQLVHKIIHPMNVNIFFLLIFTPLSVALWYKCVTVFGGGQRGRFIYLFL